MNKHVELLDISGLLQRSWRLKSHVEITNEQKKLLRHPIVEQGHFKLIEVRLFWRQVTTQFCFLNIRVQLIIVLTFDQGGQLWLHFSLLPVHNDVHGSGVRFDLILTRQFFKVAYALCISRIILKTTVDNIIL